MDFFKIPLKSISGRLKGKGREIDFKGDVLKNPYKGTRFC